MKKLLLLILICMCPVSIQARELTDKQKTTADVLANVCTENWKTHGVLPSVCIGQAFVESTLGKYCSGYNLWGIRSGAEHYDSLEDGVMRYLEVINNGYYDAALFKKDYKQQLKAILDGGYCQPVGDYYSNALWIIDNYNLDEYDKKLFRKLHQERKFRVIHDENVPKGSVVVDENIIPSGSVCIYINKKLYKIYDVSGGGIDNIIRVNDKMIDRFRVDIEVYEGAVG